jgi:hypothetical protein
MISLPICILKSNSTLFKRSRNKHYKNRKLECVQGEDHLLIGAGFVVQATNDSSNEHRPKNADGSLLHYIEWGEIIHHIFQTSSRMHFLADTHADRSDIYCIFDLINDNHMSYCVILFNFAEQGIKNVKDSVKRAEAFKAAAENSGGRYIAEYYTFGTTL